MRRIISRQRDTRWELSHNLRGALFRETDDPLSPRATSAFAEAINRPPNLVICRTYFGDELRDPDEKAN